MIWLLGLLDDFQVDILDLSKLIWSGQGGVSKKVGWEEMESGAKIYTPLKTNMILENPDFQ